MCKHMCKHACARVHVCACARVRVCACASMCARVTHVQGTPPVQVVMEGHQCLGVAEDPLQALRRHHAVRVVLPRHKYFLHLCILKAVLVSYIWPVFRRSVVGIVHAACPLERWRTFLVPHPYRSAPFISGSINKSGACRSICKLVGRSENREGV